MKLIDIVNGETQLYAVIGYPIEHTLSPQLQNSLNYIMNKNSTYIPIKVKENDLAEAINGLKTLGFKGFNVTIPHKQDILKFVDDLTPDGKHAGAVNTVKIENGRIIGHSTDGKGFLNDFKRLFKTNFKGAKILCLGLGGASVSVCKEIIKEFPENIVFAVRNIEKAKKNLLSHSVFNKNTKIILTSFATEEFYSYVTNSDIIINGTNVGMKPNINESLISKDLFKKEHIVYDLIYNPSETLFISYAKSKGASAETGLGMLVAQGILSWEFWNNQKVNEEIFESLLKSLRSIIK